MLFATNKSFQSLLSQASSSWGIFFSGACTTRQGQVLEEAVTQRSLRKAPGSSGLYEEVTGSY